MKIKICSVFGRYVSTAVFLAAMLLNASADAGIMQITLTVGASSTTIMDGGGLDSFPDTDKIGIVQHTLGGYLFNLTLAKNNTLGTFGLAFVEAGTNKIKQTGADPSFPTTVTIYVSATGFTMPTTPPDILVTTAGTSQLAPLNTSGTVGVSIESFYDSTNSLTTSSAGLLETGSDSDTLDKSISLTDNTALGDTFLLSSAFSAYAINLQLTAIFSGSGGEIDLDGNITFVPVPEPASFTICVILTGVGLAGFSRRRRRRQIVA